MKNVNTTFRHWYSYPLVWLVVGIPIVAILNSSVLVFFALNSKDSLVIDDYTRYANAVNLSLARDLRSKALNLSAQLSFDYKTHRVTLQIKTTETVDYENVTLKLLHATDKRQDQLLPIKIHSDGTLSAQLMPLHPGFWYVHIDHKQWRLVKRVYLGRESQITIKPPNAS